MTNKKVQVLTLAKKDMKGIAIYVFLQSKEKEAVKKVITPIKRQISNLRFISEVGEKRIIKGHEYRKLVVGS